MGTTVSDPLLQTAPLELTGSAVTGDVEDKIVKTTATGALPILDGSNLTDVPDTDTDSSASVYARFTNAPAGTVVTNDVIEWGTENLNAGGVFTRVDANDHIQVSEAGVYRVDFSIPVSVTATAAIEFTLQKDAGTGTWADVGPLAGCVGFAFFGNANSSASQVLTLLANEKIRVLCKNRYGSGSSVLPASGSLSIQKIN